MKKSLYAFVALVLIASQTVTSTAIAANSANSLAKQIVLAQISIAQRAGEDLDFGTAVQGAVALTLNPAHDRGWHYRYFGCSCFSCLHRNCIDNFYVTTYSTISFNDL